MNGGFQDAQARRNWLERLVDKIPGFRGYQDRELRRDVDRMQREYLSRRLGELKGVVRRRARDFTDAGQIGRLDLFERLDRELDGISQAVRFADYGASGFFDVVKFGEAELERLYQFDLGILEDIEALAADLEAVPPPGSGDPGQAVGRAADRIGELRKTWSERGNVVSEVVKTSS
jgi:hypothetical protein